VLSYNLDKIISPGMRLTRKPHKNIMSPLNTLVQKKVSLKSYKYDSIGIGTKRTYILTNKIL